MGWNRDQFDKSHKHNPHRAHKKICLFPKKCLDRKFKKYRINTITQKSDDDYLGEQ